MNENIKTRKSFFVFAFLAALVMLESFVYAQYYDPGYAPQYDPGYYNGNNYNNNYYGNYQQPYGVTSFGGGSYDPYYNGNYNSGNYYDQYAYNYNGNYNYDYINNYNYSPSVSVAAVPYYGGYDNYNNNYGNYSYNNNYNNNYYGYQNVSAVTYAATNAGPTSATINGYVYGSNARAWFQYGTSYSNLSNSSNPANIYSSTSINSHLTGLSCGRTYYFRAVASGQNGLVYGSTLSFTTANCYNTYNYNYNNNYNPYITGYNNYNYGYDY